MLKDLLLKSRSYRSFDPNVKITEEQLKEWVDAVRFAPSSINKQPLKYRLVFTEEELEIVRPLTHWAGGLPKLEIPPKGHHAQAFIAVCHDTDVIKATEGFLKDVGIVSQVILLSAAEAGFGGCMIGNFRPEQISEALNLPANLEPKLMIALGKPDEEITLVDVVDGQTGYYRDEEGHHFVPKRSLEDILV